MRGLRNMYSMNGVIVTASFGAVSGAAIGTMCAVDEIIQNSHRPATSYDVMDSAFRFPLFAAAGAMAGAATMPFLIQGAPAIAGGAIMNYYRDDIREFRDNLLYEMEEI